MILDLTKSIVKFGKNLVAMTQKDDLFQLIKSMDRNEKGYFKKFASINGKKDNNYLRLFDALEQQKEYDEKAIKQQFKGEKFIIQLHVVKNYLFQLVLRSLRNYHHKSSVPFRVHNLFMDAELLFNRKMLDNAQKTLTKAESILDTQYYQKGLFMPLLNRERSKIMGTNFYADLSDEEMQLWGDEYIDEIDKLVIQTQYEVQFAKMMRLSRQVSYADLPAVRARFDAIVNVPCLQVDPKTLPLMLQIIYYDIYSNYYIATRQHLKYADGTDEMLALIQGNLNYFSPRQYLIALYNNASTNSIHLRFDKAQKSLEEIKGLEVDTLKDEQLKERYIWDIELDILMRKGKPGEASTWLDAHMPMLEAGMANMANGYDYRIMHEIARLYMKDGQYNRALDFINTIIQSKVLDNDAGYKYVLLAQLICNYELGNAVLVPHLLKSMNNKFLKVGEYATTEKIFIAGFKKLIKESMANRLPIIEGMRNDIIKAVPDLHQLQLGGNLEIMHWLNNKLGMATIPH